MDKKYRAVVFKTPNNNDKSENRKFIRLLDSLALEEWKDTRRPVDAGFVRKLLEENGYRDLSFTAGELLKYWRRGPLYRKKKR